MYKYMAYVIVYNYEVLPEIGQNATEFSKLD